MFQTKEPYQSDKATRQMYNSRTNITDSYRKSEHSVDNYLFDWTSRNLPSNRKYFITDLDLVIRDVRNNVENLMLVEVKRYCCNVTGCQRSTFSIVHQLIKAGLRLLKYRVKCSNGIKHKIKYHGFHLLQFERTSFEDGKVYWDFKPVTEQELIKILSFE